MTTAVIQLKLCQLTLLLTSLQRLPTSDGFHFFFQNKKENVWVLPHLASILLLHHHLVLPLFTLLQPHWSNCCSWTCQPCCLCSCWPCLVYCPFMDCALTFFRPEFKILLSEAIPDYSSAKAQIIPYSHHFLSLFPPFSSSGIVSILLTYLFPPLESKFWEGKIFLTILFSAIFVAPQKVPRT